MKLNHVEVFRNVNNEITIKQDNPADPQGVCVSLTPESIDLVVDWLKKVRDEILSENSEEELSNTNGVD